MKLAGPDRERELCIGEALAYLGELDDDELAVLEEVKANPPVGSFLWKREKQTMMLALQDAEG